MSIWAHLSIGLCLVITLRSIQNLRNLRDSLKWLHAQYDTKLAEKTRFFVCIPALNEQSTIIKTIESFLNQSYPSNLISIYIATSAKEVASPGLPTTKEVVDRYISGLDDVARNRVHVLHYPKQDGYMAHQINFVADSLCTELKKPRTYFVIYNADSHIDGDAFRIANSVAADMASSCGEQPTLLQQSAIYQYADRSSLAEGAGLHQTLWTLIHEIPKLLKQSSRVRKLKSSSFIESIKNSRIAHCVGHGLFVRGDYYVTHPLPQDILNED